MLRCILIHLDHHLYGVNQILNVPHLLLTRAYHLDQFLFLEVVLLHVHLRTELLPKQLHLRCSLYLLEFEHLLEQLSCLLLEDLQCSALGLLIVGRLREVLRFLEYFDALIGLLPSLVCNANAQVVPLGVRQLVFKCV